MSRNVKMHGKNGLTRNNPYLEFILAYPGVHQQFIDTYPGAGDSDPLIDAKGDDEVRIKTYSL